MSARERKRASQERAENTKQKLLDATLAVIHREGWSGTSTLKVCQEAQVSNGAQTHHYPKKNDLLIAALRRNRDTFTAESEKRLKRKKDQTRSVRDHIAPLRPVTRDEPYFYATVESLVAARTDDTLRDEIRAIDNEWIEEVRSFRKEDIEDRPEEYSLEDLAEMTLYFVRGLVIQRGVHRNNKHLDKLFDRWCDIVASL